MTVDQIMRNAAEGVRQATNDLVAPDLDTLLHARVVRRRRILATGVVCAALGASVSLFAATRGERSSLEVLAGRPEAGPCSLLSTADVKVAVGAEVLGVERMAAIGETERHLCAYRTESALGTITVHREDGATPRYWENKTRYRRTFPGSSVEVPKLGDDAYLAGKASLTVLSGGTMFEISAQRGGTLEAETVLPRLAAVALRRLPEPMLYDLSPHLDRIWTGPDGKPVADRPYVGAVSWVQGSSHCGWESAVLLHVGWPLGTAATTADMVRQYVRDPQSAIVGWSLDRFEGRVALPDDAAPSGYRNGEVELWLSSSDTDHAYIVTPSGTERWPRARQVVACR